MQHIGLEIFVSCTRQLNPSSRLGGVEVKRFDDLRVDTVGRTSGKCKLVLLVKHDSTVNSIKGCNNIKISHMVLQKTK